MSSQPTIWTAEDYLRQERRAEHKSEYRHGEIVAMAGGSRRHALIITNIVREVGQELKGRRCEVYSNDLRLRVAPEGLYTYPDVMVVCGEARFADNQKDTLLNPVVIVEVLSDSTQNYDRGEKFEEYLTLPSLREYLTVSQKAPHIEHWSRGADNRWVLTEFIGVDGKIALESIGCTIPLAEIYHKIEWESAQR